MRTDHELCPRREKRIFGIPVCNRFRLSERRAGNGSAGRGREDFFILVLDETETVGADLGLVLAAACIVEDLRQSVGRL